MGSDRAETDPVLARIQAKIAAWQAAADSYRAALALEQSSDLEGGNGARTGGAIELPIGAFRGMKIPEAVKLFLQATRRKQTAREIAAGLREGGMETTAKNFETTVAGALHRMKIDGEVLRFKDGWDLAEAHSTALRNRLAKDTTKPPKGPKGKTRQRTTAKAKRSASTAKPSAPKGPTIDDRMLAFLSSRPLEWFTPKQVGEAVKEPNPRMVNMGFARLVRYGRVAKQADGRYAAVKK